MLIVRKGDIYMYDNAMLEELKKLEEEIRFPSFDMDDAYALGTALREAGMKAPKPIAVRIVLDGLIVYQSFLPGTNESNNQWSPSCLEPMKAITSG